MLSPSSASVTNSFSRSVVLHRHRSSSHSSHPKPEPRPKTRLLRIDEIPAWYRDNPFILGSYRPVSFSTVTCLRSWTYLHNETINIYTHLVAAAVFIFAQAALQCRITSINPDVAIGDRLAVALEGFTAAACFLSSVTYHSLLCHSEPVSRFSLKCDYAGIITLIIGNFLSGLYITFHCKPHLANAYSLMTLSLGMITSYVVLSSKFQGPKYFRVRLVAFVTMGISGFLPVSHGLVVFGPRTFLKLGAQFYLVEGLILLSGAYIFARRVPECWAPGKFDVFGGSHNIWHVLVFLAMGAHVCALLGALDYNYNYGICD